VLRTSLKHFSQILNSGQDAEIVNYWLELSLTRLGRKDFKAASTALEELNNHLSLRTFLVGYIDTVADIAVFASVYILPFARDMLPALPGSPTTSNDTTGSGEEFVTATSTMENSEAGFFTTSDNPSVLVLRSLSPSLVDFLCFTHTGIATWFRKLLAIRMSSESRKCGCPKLPCGFITELCHSLWDPVAHLIEG
jgi:hypothetical protein